MLVYEEMVEILYNTEAEKEFRDKEFLTPAQIKSVCRLAVAVIIEKGDILFKGNLNNTPNK